MGILTSSTSDSSSNLSRHFQRATTPLSILFFVGGISYFGVILWPSFNHETYISENALLPGVVDEQFNLGRFMYQKLDALKQHVKSNKIGKRTIPYDWLYKEFLDARLEPYVQNFSIRYPLGISSSYSGRNVFGVIRAPRGSSTEAAVIAVPYDLSMAPALVVLLGIAKFCREQIYWAKDLYFVVAERRELGMQAWLNAYHGKEDNNYIIADELPTHSGPIQAGVCLELTETNGLTQAEVMYNMINGQLPNLDLFNVVVRLAEKHHMWATIFGKQESYGISYTYDGYMNFLATASSGILGQAVGLTPGLHSVFGPFNIEAVTLRPSNGKYEYGGGVDLSGVARALEGILRSINNLLERFHQSFFFYVLVSPHRYISIGVYMPAIGAMLLAPVLKACALWMAMISDEEDQTKQKEDETGSTKSAQTKKAPNKAAFSLWAVAPYFIAAHLFGVLIRIFPDYVQVWIPSIQAASILKEYFLATVAVVLLYSFSFPLLMKLFRKSNGHTTPSSNLFRCLCLLELALVVGAISVLNFGLGFILCVFWVPVFSLISPSRNWAVWLLKSMALILTNPLLMLFIGHCLLLAPSNWLDTTYVLKAIALSKDSLLAMLVGNYLFGSWLFTVCSVVLLPIWMQFWALLHLPH